MSRQERVPMGEAARRYAAGGWPVFPLHDVVNGRCSCAAGPDCGQPGKHPRTADGFHAATTDLERVQRWWRRWPHANLATPNGRRSGLVVVDLDGQAGEETWLELAAPYQVPRGELGWYRTPSGWSARAETATVDTPHGQHRWYRLPSGLDVPRRIGLREGVDLLGDGGYTVLPPSRTLCAKPADRHGRGPCRDGYTWTRKGRLADLPEWVVRLERERTAAANVPQATPAPVRQAMRAAGGRGYGRAALAGEAARVAAAPAGARNHTLNMAAWRLGRLAAAGELDADQARTALHEAAAACGLGSDDGQRQVMATIESGLRAGMASGRSPRQEKARQAGSRQPSAPKPVVRGRRSAPVSGIWAS